MARIHNDDKFLHFDAISGYKSLTDTIKREMPDEFSRLVLDIGDLDPDDAYSAVAYEKGASSLLYLFDCGTWEGHR
jgi:leukotriene-A4 hydrolase